MDCGSRTCTFRPVLPPKSEYRAEFRWDNTLFSLYPKALFARDNSTNDSNFIPTSRDSFSASLINAGDIFGQFLFMFQVALAGNHNPLGLRRSGAVHGFGAITDGGRPQGNIFYQSHDAAAVFGGH